MKTESLQEQLSYGATISAKPFVADNIKPGVVVNLVGYKLGDNTAFVVWESPEDNDIENLLLHWVLKRLQWMPRLLMVLYMVI